MKEMNILGVSLWVHCWLAIVYIFNVACMCKGIILGENSILKTLALEYETLSWRPGSTTYWLCALGYIENLSLFPQWQKWK